MLLDAFFNARPDKFVPTFFDEAGHRVATQYVELDTCFTMESGKGHTISSLIVYSLSLW